MNKFYKAVAIGFIAVASLTGCAGNGDNGNDSSSSQQSNVTAKDAANFTAQYYQDMIDESKNGTASYNKLDDTLKNNMSDDEYKKFSESTSPFTSLDVVAKDKQEKLANEVQALNPLADDYNYDGMSDNDRTYVNLLSIASTSYLASYTANSSASESAKDIKVNVPEDKVKIDGDKATIKYSDIEVTINGQKQNNSDSSTDGVNTLRLTHKDGSWKVDGKETLEDVKAATKAQESATADPSTGVSQ